MKEEAELLEKLSALEAELGRFARERDWTRLDGTLCEVKTMGEKASQADQLRAVVYEKIKRSCRAQRAETFQEVLARVPAEEWGSLPELHRRVRMAVEKIKSLTGCLDTYISSAVNTLDRVLEEIFPDRQNKVYTRTGFAFGAGAPLMVSRSI